MKPIQTLSLLLLLGVAAFPLACKDEEPCDEGQDSIGTGCYAKPVAEAGAPSTSDGGAPQAAAGAAAEGGKAEPSGNPDAMFQDSCETDADCGGPAPVCLIAPGPLYCSQIDCLDDEVNAGACPEGWVCFKLNPETRSACLKTN